MTTMQDKVVIVTGGTRGQGEAELRLLVERGARVVFGGRDVAAGQAIAAELGAGAVFMKHDVADESAWQAIIALTVERFGRIDGLVNNAGSLILGRVHELDAETVVTGWRSNQLGQLLGMKHVVPAMKRNGRGAIVNIGSEAASRGTAYTAAYAGAKAAVAGMTRAAAVELAGDGIRVNLVTPGPIDTPMLRNASGKGGPERISKTVPLGRIGRAIDVAYAVAFLLSDEADFITGAEIAVDGGRSIAAVSF